MERTTRHPGYAISQRKRKLVEHVFGWMKTVGGLRKLRHRGEPLVDWIVTFSDCRVATTHHAHLFPVRKLARGRQRKR